MTLIGYGLAVCIGLSLGLIGGGGSVLALPVLIYVMGVPTKSAIAMTLAIIGSVSFIGSLSHWRVGNIHFQAALMLAPATMIGAFLGAKIAMLPSVSETVQLMGFVIMMLIASGFMIRKSSQSRLEPSPKLEQFSTPLQGFLLIPLAGLGVGLVSGLVGIGGGFLVIPALVLLVGIPMKQAIGTSLLVISFQSVTGFWGYLSSQVPINWSLVISFIFASTVGIFLGSYLTQFVSAKQLEKGFGYFLLGVAVVMAIKA